MSDILPENCGERIHLQSTQTLKGISGNGTFHRCIFSTGSWPLDCVRCVHRGNGIECVDCVEDAAKAKKIKRKEKYENGGKNEL